PQVAFGVWVASQLYTTSDKVWVLALSAWPAALTMHGIWGLATADREKSNDTPYYRVSDRRSWSVAPTVVSDGTNFVPGLGGVGRVLIGPGGRGVRGRPAAAAAPPPEPTATPPDVKVGRARRGRAQLPQPREVSATADPGAGRLPRRSRAARTGQTAGGARVARARGRDCAHPAFRRRRGRTRSRRHPIHRRRAGHTRAGTARARRHPGRAAARSVGARAVRAAARGLRRRRTG